MVVDALLSLSRPPANSNATAARGRARAPLSSVDANLVGKDNPRTPRDFIKKRPTGSGRVVSTKKKQSRRRPPRPKNEIYTPLVVHGSARSRSERPAFDTARAMAPQPSQSAHAPTHADQSDGEALQPSRGPELAGNDAVPTDRSESKAAEGQDASIPVAHLGSHEDVVLALNFGYQSNVVGKVRSLPFRLEAPSSRIPIEFERIPFASGFDVVVGGRDAVREEYVACNGTSLVHAKEPTVICLQRTESKLFHVLWTPTRAGEVREEIGLKSPWGRHQITLLGIARDDTELPKAAKSAGRPSEVDRFYGRDNITYDTQQWEDAQCSTFMEWLNRLFQSTNDARPIGEAQLRSEWEAARKVFDAPKMQAVQCTVEREVTEGRLANVARSSRHFLDEVHVQEQLTKLLLSYSPRWLQLGLGIVLSTWTDDSSFEKLMMTSRMTKDTLKKIIMQRVLTDPATVRKFTGGRCKTPSGKFESKMNITVHQHALSQIMILVFFLDKAKKNRILAEDPCLFEKSSHMKSSDEVLVSLCQDCFSMQVSTIRHLAYEGVSVSHVQQPLDEYDFYVSNLAVDLKDGVCLAKLIDIVTERSNLLSSMRLPAETRKYKTYNVNLALSALRHLGVPHISDITTAHIVDAHQPRVIQLLWSSILHFELPEFRQEIIEYNAARLIQSHSRRFLATRSYWIARHGTLLCQSLFRGFIVRVSVRRMSTSATDLQKIWRGYCAKRSYGLELARIITVQSVCRRLLARRRFDEMSRSMNNASTEIQRVWRGFSAKVGFGCDLMDIIAVQSLCRRFIASNRVARIKAMGDASTTIQRVWRGYIAKLMFGCDLIDIITMQSVGRRFLARRAMAKRHACSRRIQSTARMWAAMRMHRNRKRGIKTIRAHFRRALALRRVSDVKARIVRLQRVCRGWLCRKQVRLASKQCHASKADEARDATVAHAEVTAELPGSVTCSTTPEDSVEISFTSSHASRNRNLGEMAHVVCGVEHAENDIDVVLTTTTCDSLSPNDVGMSCTAKPTPATGGDFTAENPVVDGSSPEVQSSPLTCSSSAEASVAQEENEISISSSTRHAHATQDFCPVGKIAELADMAPLENDSRAINSVKVSSESDGAPMDSLATIDEGATDLLSFDKEKTASTLIQKMWRCYSALKLFICQKNAALLCQTTWRRFAAEKQVLQLRQLARDAAATKLSSAYRSHATRVSLKHALAGIVAMQTVYRKQRAHRLVVETMSSTHIEANQCATIVQKCLRRHTCQSHYATLRAATLSIQSQARCWLARAAVRNARRGEAAKTIQAAYRGFAAFDHFFITKFAASIIQSTYRRYALAQNYCSLRKSVVAAQALCRGRKARMDISVQHQHIGVLQRAGRRFLAKLGVRRTILSSATSLQMAESSVAVSIQRCWRGCKANVDFMLILLATIKIQSIVRRRIATARFRHVVKAVICVQATFRGKRAQRALALRQENAVILQAVSRRFLARLEAQRVIDAVVTIQRAGRATLTRMHNEVECFAATEIQRVFRGYIRSTDFMLSIIAAIKIQAAMRGRRARHVADTRRKAVSTMQRAARIMISREQDEVERFASTEIQRMWRGYKANVDFMLLVISAISVQTAVRRSQARQRVVLHRQSIGVLQRAGRGFLARLEKDRVTAAVMTLQRAARVMLVCMRRRDSECSAAVSIQCIWRGYKANVDFMLAVVSAITIQSFARHVLAKANAKQASEKRLLAKAEMERLVRERILCQRREEEKTHCSDRSPGLSWAKARYDVSPQNEQHKSHFEFTLQSSVRSNGVKQQMLGPHGNESADATTPTSTNPAGGSLILFHTPSPLLEASHSTPGDASDDQEWRPLNSFVASDVSASRSPKQLCQSKSPSMNTPSQTHKREPSKFARHTAKALRTLQKSKKFSEVMKAALNLQMITQDSSEDCKLIVEADAPRRMLSIIRSCNRSSPHLELIRVLLSVMTNLSEHPSILSLLANEKMINATTDLVQMFRDKSAIFSLSSSLLERMLRGASASTVSKYSTPENKKRLHGILRLSKEKTSELDALHRGMLYLESVIRMVNVNCT